MSRVLDLCAVTMKRLGQRKVRALWQTLASRATKIFTTELVFPALNYLFRPNCPSILFVSEGFTFWEPGGKTGFVFGAGDASAGELFCIIFFLAESDRRTGNCRLLPHSSEGSAPRQTRHFDFPQPRRNFHRSIKIFIGLWAEILPGSRILPGDYPNRNQQSLRYNQFNWE